jgi:hypothetical protein
LRVPVLTINRGLHYICRYGAPPALRARWCVAEASHLFGDQAPDCGRRLAASTAHRLTGGWGPPWFPGCLKSESEERETWTAESLRAASYGGGSCRKTWFLVAGAVGRDFGGTRLRYISGRASGQVMDLVKMWRRASVVARNVVNRRDNSHPT